ncbi:MAG: hypothetical protein C4554_00460 [Dethiobacter sp.]|nr:MAG: hypothetical protein C4554_00460 [Dethiobacter sp.]
MPTTLRVKTKMDENDLCSEMKRRAFRAELVAPLQQTLLLKPVSSEPLSEHQPLPPHFIPEGGIRGRPFLAFTGKMCR